MSGYDKQKCLEMSQSISAIYEHAEASLAEVCSSTALALRVALDNEPDKLLRGYLFMMLVKHLTMDHKSEEARLPSIEIIRPN